MKLEESITAIDLVSLSATFGKREWNNEYGISANLLWDDNRRLSPFSFDNKTIRLSEGSSVSEKKVQLIIIPEKASKPKRKAGLLKGKIKMSENFNET